MANAYGDILKMIKNAEAAKTPGEEFVADLSRCVQLSKEKRVPSRSIKPSSLGGCFRNQWFMLQGAQMDVGLLEKAENIAIQDSGNDIHNRIQNYCQAAEGLHIPIVWCDPTEEANRAASMGINTTIKRKDGNELLCHNSDYNCNFKCDGIIKYKDVKYILEIKSEEYYKFNTRVAAEHTHEYQAVMYCICFGIDRVMFVYRDRNLCMTKAYVVVVTDEFKAEVKARIAHILLYDKTNTCPPKEKDKCTYCHYKQLCKKLGDTEAKTVDDLKLIDAKAQLAERRAKEKADGEEKQEGR
jgi:CRISPR/Cas system-associated exonuclease Cas4 (RecB family)